MWYEGTGTKANAAMHKLTFYHQATACSVHSGCVQHLPQWIELTQIISGDGMRGILCLREMCTPYSTV